MKCYYNAPEKCESVEDVLDYEKGGHCWRCIYTDLGHSEMAPAKLGTGGVSFAQQMRAEKRYKKQKIGDKKGPTIYSRLAMEANKRFGARSFQ